MKILLQKVMASSGNYSRREAEELIRAGKVLLNDEPAFLGERAEPGVDVIKVDGKILGGASELIYIKLNKPAGFVSTTARFRDEKSVFDLVSVKEKLFPVGRLDKDSRGLILLTNDGDLAQKLSHPRFEHEKVYEIRVRFNKIERDYKPDDIMRALEEGFDIGEGDGLARAKKAEYLQNDFFRVTLTQGKKRQLRRMFSLLSFKILDLKRVEFSALKVGSLKEGTWAYLSKKEVEDLRKS